MRDNTLMIKELIGSTIIDCRDGDDECSQSVEIVLDNGKLLTVDSDYCMYREQSYVIVYVEEE